MTKGMMPTSWDFALPPAEIHERYLVPAVYAQWAAKMTHLAEIDAGCSVLDVGCGTGILARCAAEEVGLSGTVCGLDHDAEMLAVAAGTSSMIEWRLGDAGNLPFEQATFDRVLSQFMLPHLKNRVASVREMWRVLKPGGRLLLAVWGPLHSAPAFRAVVQLIDAEAGRKVAEMAALPWALGSDSTLASVLNTAGVRGYSQIQQRGTARFPGAPEILEVWVRRSPAGAELSERQFREISAAARSELERYRVPGGEIVCALNAKIVTASKD